MYISNSLTQEKKAISAIVVDNQEFRQLLSELQLYYRDNDIDLKPENKFEILHSFWDTTFYLFKYTPIHDVLLSYIGSYFCIQEKIKKKSDLLQCIGNMKDQTADISIEWGLKCWIVLLNNTTFRFPQVAIDRIIAKMYPILDIYYKKENSF